MNTSAARVLFAVLPALLMLAGCKPSPPPDETGWLPGYLEADVIEIASPEAGYLAERPATRGQRVAKDAALFTLDATPLRQERAAAQARREAAEKRAADAALGERDETLRRIDADLAAAKEALGFARLEQARLRGLLEKTVATRAQMDAADSAVKQQEEKVHSLEAVGALARKGQRPLVIEALAAEAASLQAAEVLLDWRIAQTCARRPPMPGRGHPARTRRMGPRRPARRAAARRRPARALLPAARPRRRPPQGRCARRPPARGRALHAAVTRIADQAEFTLPVIYSREEAERLVILVEAALAPADAERLHPGLPVTVRPPAHSAP
ncbi:MAG: hypothetical protein U1F87_08995 [Kiritimatiellia bacterium]